MRQKTKEMSEQHGAKREREEAKVYARLWGSCSRWCRPSAGADADLTFVRSSLSWQSVSFAGVKKVIEDPIYSIVEFVVMVI